MDCKVNMAALNEALENSKLHIIELAGHTMDDANMRSKVMECIEEIKGVDWK